MKRPMPTLRMGPLSCLLLLVAASCAHTPGSSGEDGISPAPARRLPACTRTPDENRRIVLDFYRLALTERDPKAAFRRYASSDFVEHKADVPGGTRAATASYLDQLIKSFPRPDWEIVRTIAEGDLVFLHVRFTPAPNAPAYSIGDIFRLEDCSVVEHWDIVAPPPARKDNPNPRF